MIIDVNFYFNIFTGVYSLCDGPRLSGGPYLGITTTCCVLSVVFVGVKGSYVFSVLEVDRGEYVRAMEMGLIISSLVLAIGHIVVAYKISCKERRKLLVYKIDIEAVSLLSTFFVFPFFCFLLRIKSNEIFEMG